MRDEESEEKGYRRGGKIDQGLVYGDLVRRLYCGELAHGLVWSLSGPDVSTHVAGQGDFDDAVARLHGPRNANAIRARRTDAIVVRCQVATESSNLTEQDLYSFAHSRGRP